MTKYEVVVTVPAVEDIVDIVGYLQRLTKSNDTADQYMMGILDIIKSLEEMPSRFQIVDNPDLAGVRCPLHILQELYHLIFRHRN